MESVLLNIKDIASSGRWDYDYNQVKYVDFERKLQSIETESLQNFCKQSITKGETPLWKGDKYVTETEGVLFIRSENVREYGLDLSSKTFVPTHVHERMQRSQVQAGDVLLAIVGATIGQVAVVPDDIEAANCNQAVAIIRPREDVNPYYLRAILQSTLGQTQIHRLSGGTARPNLDLWEARILRIPAVSKSLQDKIAQVMQEAYGERQEKLEQLAGESQRSEKILSEYLKIKKTEPPIEKHFVKSINDLRERMDVHYHMPHFLSKINALYSGDYKLSTVQEIALKIVNGATPRAKGEAYTQESDQGVPFIRVTDISNYSVNRENILYIRRSVHEKDLKRSQVAPGDVLLSMAGTIGLSAVIPFSMPEANINQAIASIRVNSDICPRYLEIFMNSWMGRTQTHRLSRPVVQSNINLSEIKRILIPIPPKSIQEEIAARVEAIRNESNDLRQEAEAVVAKAKARVEKMILGEEITDSE